MDDNDNPFKWKERDCNMLCHETIILASCAFFDTDSWMIGNKFDKDR